jgi:hypothetical protein
MKKIISVLAVLLIISVSVSSCKKESTVISTSNWKIGEKTYAGTTTIVGSSYGTNFLESNEVSDSTTNFILIQFGSEPTTTQKFGVAGYGTSPTSTQCIILTAEAVGTTQPVNPLFESVGNPGDSIAVSVINGKINVSFSNIIVANPNQTLVLSSLSGTLIQQ